MKSIANRSSVIYALVIAFIAGVGFLLFSFYKYGNEWATDRTNRHIYSNRTVTNAGTIFDRNGIVLAKSENGKRYFSDDKQVRKAVLHIVGDTSGFISTGTHTLFDDLLIGYTRINGIYSLTKKGTGNDIVLNIDAGACKAAYNAFGDYNGAVAVYNYKTGELLCSVSRISYDPHNVPDNLRTDEKYEGVFIDRVVSGLYTPGSIMKIITAASAIENIPDIYEQKFVCSGEYKTGDGKVVCNGVHGEIDFQKAMNESCNCAFANISIQLGAEKILETAQKFGFNKKINAKDVPLAKSTFYPDSNSKTELAWAGIGQSTTLVNPCHFLTIIGCIANEGHGFAPDRIKTTGSAVIKRMPQEIISIEPEIANKLNALLRSNVQDKYGDNKFQGLVMCGKTGTAEIDGAKSHSWFAGYSMNSEFPLAAICIAENAGWGSGAALNICNTVLHYFLNNGIS
ncbi:MAG: hypothetical protein K6B52_08505 [Clostridiales bacterium]|nr:hypothetical protein [Clostridiales bacterium]